MEYPWTDDIKIMIIVCRLNELLAIQLLSKNIRTFIQAVAAPEQAVLHSELSYNFNLD